MFATLARAAFAGRRHRPAMRARPAYANDNQIKTAVAARSHGNRPRLECRWHRSPVTGRLECRWGLEDGAADPATESGPSWLEAENRRRILRPQTGKIIVANNSHLRNRSFGVAWRPGGLSDAA
jgi:hypothetical protein